MLKAAEPRFPGCRFSESHFSPRDGGSISAEKLYEAAAGQKCRKYKLPLEFLDLDITPWGSQAKTVFGFIDHLKRVQEVDPEIPIIVTPEGYIADGWHRVIRAFMEGRSFVWAYRLKELPEVAEEE